jgi:hypothetical protein
MGHERSSDRHSREVTAGSEIGRFVEVIDDTCQTGGYLIFTYADVDRSPEVFDAWVPSIVDVDLYFDDSGWEVEWFNAERPVANPGPQ